MDRSFKDETLYFQITEHMIENNCNLKIINKEYITIKFPDESNLRHYVPYTLQQKIRELQMQAQN